MPQPFKSIIPTGGDFPTEVGGAWPAAPAPAAGPTVIAPNAEGVWAPADLAKALELEHPSTVRAFHAQTAAPLDLPPAEVEKGFKSHALTVGTGDTFHVRLPDGTIKKVTGGELGQHLDAGAHLASARDARDAELKDKSGTAGDILSTLGEGLGRGFLGGASDTWKTADEAEEAQARKEDHGILSGLAEAGGVLAQQALLPGGGLAGAAEEGGSMLARLAGASSEGGFLSRAAAKALPQALRAGAEGAAIGHAEAISDEALGGGPLTAEKYLGTVGSNALWGAGLGTAGAVAGEALGTGLRAAKKAGGNLLDTLVSKVAKAPEAADIETTAAKAYGYAPKGVGEATLDAEANSVEKIAERAKLREEALRKVTGDLADVDSKLPDLNKSKSTPVKVTLEQVERTPEEIAEYVKSHVLDKDVQAFINDSRKIPDAIKFKSVATEASMEADQAARSAKTTFEAARSALTDHLTPEATAKYVTDTVNPSTSATHKVIADYLSAAKNLGDVLKVKSVASAADKAAKNLAEVAESVSKANQVEALLKAGATNGESIADIFERIGPSKMAADKVLKGAGAAIGHTVGGPLGGFLGYQGGKAAAKLTELASVQGALSSFDRKIGNAVASFFNRSSEVEPIAARSTTKEAVVKAAKSIKRGGKLAERESTREAYDRRIERLKTLQQPGALAQALSEHTTALQTNLPQTSSAIPSVAARALAYLTGHMPSTAMADPLTGKTAPVSVSEMNAFNLRAQAVEHPETVVEDLAKGRVTVEQIDALKNVYPQIYEELQQKVAESVQAHVAAGKPLSFQQRVSLGVLMDVPTDPSLSNPAVSHAAATFAVPAGPSPNKGSGGAPPGKSAKGNETTTPEQRLSAA